MLHLFSNFLIGIVKIYRLNWNGIAYLLKREDCDIMKLVYYHIICYLFQVIGTTHSLILLKLQQTPHSSIQFTKSQNVKISYVNDQRIYSKRDIYIPIQKTSPPKEQPSIQHGYILKCKCIDDPCHQCIHHGTSIGKTSSALGIHIGSVWTCLERWELVHYKIN